MRAEVQWFRRSGTSNWRPAQRPEPGELDGATLIQRSIGDRMWAVDGGWVGASAVRCSDGE